MALSSSEKVYMAKLAEMAKRYVKRFYLVTSLAQVVALAIKKCVIIW